MIGEIVGGALGEDFVTAVRAYDRLLICGLLRPAAVPSAGTMAGALEVSSSIPETTPLTAISCPAFWRDPASVE